MIGLAVALLALAGILLFAIIKRVMFKRELEEKSKDISVEDATAVPPPDVYVVTDASSEPSGPTPFEAEETVMGDLPGSPEKGEMTTVEII